jgi:two-component system NtrC family sensor kinase
MPEPQRPLQRMQSVLVVEDDHELADLLQEVLTFENCAVDIASNGMEAMEKLRGQHYDAVICDLMMPRLDGEALYHEVVRHFPYLAERFVFMTSQASKRAGFADFVFRTGNGLLEKPFEMQELRDALRELLAR